MTDKRLDELLQASLKADAQPPQILSADKRKTPRRAWLGALAACLCLVLSAGAFFLLDFGAATAPEAAADGLNQKVSGTGAAVPESEMKYSVTMDSASAVLEPMAPPAAAAPAAPMAPMEPLNGAAAETCSPSSSKNAWWQAMKNEIYPRFDIDDYETNYTVMGDSDRYYSICVSKGDDFGYFTVDKSTCKLVKLEDVRDKLETTVIENTALECRVDRSPMFFINSDDHLTIIE